MSQTRVRLIRVFGVFALLNYIGHLVLASLIQKNMLEATVNAVSFLFATFYMAVGFFMAAVVFYLFHKTENDIF